MCDRLGNHKAYLNKRLTKIRIDLGLCQYLRCIVFISLKIRSSLQCFFSISMWLSCLFNILIRHGLSNNLSLAWVFWLIWTYIFAKNFLSVPAIETAVNSAAIFVSYFTTTTVPYRSIATAKGTKADGSFRKERLYLTHHTGGEYLHGLLL